MNSGPSAQELKQLQRRLEEVCQPRHRKSSMTSVGSITSMEDLNNHRRPRARTLPTDTSLHQVWSSASVSTLASDPLDGDVDMDYGLDGLNVEFDLTIEEVPSTNPDTGVQAPFSLSSLEPQDPPLQPAVYRAPSPSGSQQGSIQQCPRSPTNGRRSTPPESTKPLQPAPSSGDGSFNTVPWHRRPWPKEYRHGHVPKNLNLEEEYKNVREAAPTTLMIRNIPNHYTQRQLINELDDLGFKGTFDFLYIPLDKGTMSNVGYAFVNFVEPEWAERCMTAFQSYRFKRHRKIAAVSIAHIQGLEANLAHYENAAVNTAKLKQRRPVIMANISQTLSSAIDSCE